MPSSEGVGLFDAPRTKGRKFVWENQGENDGRWERGEEREPRKSVNLGLRHLWIGPKIIHKSLFRPHSTCIESLPLKAEVVT